MASEILQQRLQALARVAKEFPEFKYFDDPVLLKPTINVSVEEGKEIGEMLGKILMKYHEIMGYGRGLAANQVGLPYSIFATYLENQIQIYINPKILKFSKDQCLCRELCLSNRTTWGDIKRSSEIIMEWTDVNGLLKKQDFSGGKARIFQHETGHLKGVNSLKLAESGTVEVCLVDPTKETIRPV